MNQPTHKFSPKRIEYFDVIVLGAGAAGLMCAAVAAERGRRVLVLEVSNKPGKKILMSGGGCCNFTNLHVSAENFICHNPHFVKSALQQYTPQDFIAWVEQNEVAYHEKESGQLFCDDSAKHILNMLLDRCNLANVEIRLNAETDDIKVSSGQAGFLLAVGAQALQTSSLVVATGGLSIPSLGGASGFGYQLARQFGLEVMPTRASLVPFTLSGHWHEFCSVLSGVSLPVEASVADCLFSGSMLFTHRGLSGPVMLQLSNYWSSGQEIEINVLPDDDLFSLLQDQKVTSPNQTISSVLRRLFPKSLALALRDKYLLRDGNSEQSLQHYTLVELAALAKNLVVWQLKPSGTEGYRTAEVTKAGVCVDAFSSKTMQCNTVSGLYFIGEVLDVTGHLGGFNFQWAWSSGYVAGMNA